MKPGMGRFLVGRNPLSRGPGRLRAAAGALSVLVVAAVVVVPAAPAVADATAPTLTSAAFVDAGVQLAFTAPADTGGATITDYEYDVSYDGGTTWAGGSPDTFFNLLGTTTGPGIDGNGCPQSTVCTYRVRA